MYSDVIETAIGRLVLNHPFISSVLLATNIYETEDTATADTNGDWIRINPKFIENMAGPVQKDQINLAMFVLAHEVYHIALMHPFRRGDRSATLIDAQGNPTTVWNIAADGQINPSLKVDGFVVPQLAYLHPNGENMYVEEIYEELLKQYKNNPNIKSISFGDVSDGDEDGEGEGDSDAEKAAREQRAQLKVQKAMDVAKAEGNLPASMARMIENAMEAKIPWQELLREAVTTITKPDDYTWSRCNRRFIHQNMWLPGMEGTQTGPIAIEIDTSGSVGGADLEAFLGEINGIIEDTHPEQVWVGFCDSQHYGFNEIEAGEALDTTEFNKLVKGGGGTAFKPAFDGIKKEGIQPDMMIYFTDLYGSDFGEEPPYPVIWVTTGSTEAPWGRVIKLER